MLARLKFQLVAAALALGLATAPALAQQGGLVNIQIGDIETGDILSENQLNVGAALQLAANVCGVSVGVLSAQLGSGFARCENEQTGRFAQITR